MTLEQRIDCMVHLGEYISANSPEWQEAKENAARQNAWFTPAFIQAATEAIASNFLQRELLEQWVAHYQIPQEQNNPQTVGIVMAGNIPLVGFHDFLCVFITGHYAVIKLSSKDDVLLKHLLQYLHKVVVVIQNYISIAEKLTGCQAYIATGSTNSGRYFDYYFGKYPNIIRKNRTSVAILTGDETAEELSYLATDIQQYFGLGCRNVTQLYVPKNYSFDALLNALTQFDEHIIAHKYKHNFDYQLALLLMTSKTYLSNGSILLVEDERPFSAVSVLHYQYYENLAEVENVLATKTDQIQAIVGAGHIPFGKAQQPSLTDYADGVDTMQFLTTLA